MYNHVIFKTHIITHLLYSYGCVLDLKIFMSLNLVKIKELKLPVFVGVVAI